MTDSEYVVFERPGVKRLGASVRLGRPSIGTRLGTDAIQSLSDTSPSSREVLSSIDQATADRARRDGNEVFRIPKMPLRLIPQMNAGGDDIPGEPWGIAGTGADNSPYKGEGICVAILDTGIDAGHEAFQGLITKRNCEDFTGRGPKDNIGHGTHCAGIIFGRPVGGVRIGIAPGVKNVLVGKIADTDFDATTLLLQQAMMWSIANGANIISLSIGLDFLGHSQRPQRGVSSDVALASALNDYRDYSRFFDRLMGMIGAAGAAGNSALVIAACGNDSHADRDGLRVPATLPAVADHVIAVGALGPGPEPGTLIVPPFSNTVVDICGPGVGILSARPGGGLATMSGTSQSAPHVAGVAALWWQKLARDRGFENVTPTLVRDALIRTARREGIVESDPNAVGAGMATAPAD